MKRTPRSASRRASRQLAAKVPGLRDVGAVQVEDVLSARSETSVSSGTDVCMRKAISYWRDARGDLRVADLVELAAG